MGDKIRVHLSRTVNLPEGNSHVEFTYRPNLGFSDFTTGESLGYQTSGGSEEFFDLTKKSGDGLLPYFLDHPTY
jgi:hypothetical protein